MFKIFYGNRFMGAEEFMPVVGDRWRKWIIIEVNYYEKAVWVA